MAEQHPWAVLPTLVQADILTTEQAAGIVLGTTVYNKLILELQSLVGEARSKGDDTIKVSQLTSLVTKIQMMESPSY